MKAANHLMFSQLLYERNIKRTTIIFSEANYLTFFLKYAHFESVCEKERKIKWGVNYLHLSVPTDNETVNLVLLQKHVYYC